MANDIKLQSSSGKHPVDENLRPILVGKKRTSIETAQHGDGARVNGDLIVTGKIEGKTDIIGLSLKLLIDQSTTHIYKMIYSKRLSFISIEFIT